MQRTIELSWKARQHDQGAPMDEAMRQTDWDALCRVATNRRDGCPCRPLDHVSNGLHHMVRLLQFSDGVRWVARIALHRSAAGSAQLRSEIDTMRWVRRRSNLPVPYVFACETDERNPVGVPYVLMQFLPGNTVTEAASGHETHDGIIPAAHRPRFYRGVARCHVETTGLRLPKIGTIHLNADGDAVVGPIPGVGGPFDTATAFLEAWVDKARFPRRPDEILHIMRGSPAAELVLDGIEAFPRRFRKVAPRLVRADRGPFPLCHPDFAHSHILADDDFHVLGVLGWEGACTLPLELVRFPRYLSCVPRLFDGPERHDADGRPLEDDDDVRQRRQERREYVQMVRSFEGAEEQTLSTCLEYEAGQTLSYLMAAYERGEMGFYNRVMDALERELSAEAAKDETVDRQDA